MITIDENWIDKITESIYNMTSGKKVNKIEIPDDFPENEVKQLIGYVNILIEQNNDISNFVYSISNGDFNYELSKSKNKLMSAFKDLQSHLRHLTWQTQQVAAGNYSQKVDFMGDFSIAFNSMTQQLKKSFEDLNKANEELMIAKDAAESANKSKSEFLANMSHEIRTPMNAILGFADILFERTIEDEQKNYLGIILSSGNALLTIINDILDLSKIEAGKLELQPDFIDLGRALLEIKQMFTQKVENKGIEFQVEYDSDLPKGIFLDEVRIRQIILNLSGNAIKFTEKGYVKVTAHHESNPDKENTVDIIITVEDTGIGIPPDQIEKIFKPFEQVSGQSTKKFGGTGLGLSISTKLIKMMNGTIGATSELGKGTIFTIILPGVPINTETEKSPDAIKEVELDITFKPAKILLIDNVETNRMVVKLFLKKYNFDFVETDNGLHGLSKIKSEKFEMVITDLKMQDLNGEELTNIIKNNEDTRNIPVIMLSASAMKEEEERISKIVDVFLTKPVNKLKLIREIKKFIPYTQNIKNNATESGNVEKSKDEFDERILNPDELIKFQTILVKYRKEWEILNKSRQITAVKEFSKKLNETAIEFGSNELINYSNELSDAANSLKVIKIKNLLGEFPKIIEKIK